MRDYLKEAALLNLIASYYPGGQEAFESEGGAIEALPWGEALMLIPEAGKTLKDMLVKEHGSVTLVNTPCISYEGRGSYEEEVIKLITALAVLLVKHNVDIVMKPNILCLCVYIPTKQLDPQLCADLTAVLKGFGGLMRAAVYWDGGHQWILQSDKPVAMIESAKRDKPIGDEDVQDIHKMLDGVKGVDDLLNNM